MTRDEQLLTKAERILADAEAWGKSAFASEHPFIELANSFGRLEGELFGLMLDLKYPTTPVIISADKGGGR